MNSCGCGTRTVLIPPGEPVRFRAPVKKAKIWAADKNRVEVPGEVTIPEGWYALPPPPEKKPVSVNEFEDPAFVVSREGRGDGVGTRKIFTR